MEKTTKTTPPLDLPDWTPSKPAPSPFKLDSPLPDEEFYGDGPSTARVPPSPPTPPVPPVPGVSMPVGLVPLPSSVPAILEVMGRAQISGGEAQAYVTVTEWLRDLHNHFNPMGKL